MSSARSPTTSRRVRSALLWGVVGTLTFLVLVQGYALVVDPLVPFGRAATVAVAVGAAAAGGAYGLEHRIAAWAARRHREDAETREDGGKSKS